MRDSLFTSMLGNVYTRVCAKALAASCGSHDDCFIAGVVPACSFWRRLRKVIGAVVGAGKTLSGGGGLASVAVILVLLFDADVDRHWRQR